MFFVPVLWSLSLRCGLCLCAVDPCTDRCLLSANSFTPWFKLIARDFLFGWWDELLARKTADGKIRAKSLAGLVDGSKVVKMV